MTRWKPMSRFVTWIHTERKPWHGRPERDTTSSSSGLSARAKTGGLHAEVARIASQFEGPQAIVAANGVHLLQPEVSRLRLLVPVNGTLVSRRAAEIAIAVARVLEAPIAALYVSNANSRSAAKSPRKPRR